MSPHSDRPIHHSKKPDLPGCNHTETVLLESEARYRTLFEQAEDSIVVFDAHTTAIVDFNGAACKRLGYTRDEFAKLQISDIEAVESAEEMKRHIASVVSKGADVFETKHRTKAGATVEFEIRATVIRIGGRVLLQNICRDITERKREQEALRRSEETFKSFFDLSKVGLSITRLSGEIRVNQALCDILGNAYAVG